MNLFTQLKKINKFSKEEFKKNVDLSQIQEDIGDEFFHLLNKVFENRQIDPTNSKIKKEDIQDVINNYSTKNIAVAATSSFVPGPVGLLSVGPEMILTVSNQMMMIYDIGCGFDKENFLNKDVLIDIPLQAAGINTNLHHIQANPTNLIDSTPNILKDKALSFAKMSFDKMVKTSITKWIPVGGTIMMTVWSKMSTQKIATTSMNFFDDNKILIPPKSKSLSLKEEQDLLINRIKILINLIEIDGDISSQEIAFIEPMIKKSDLENSLKESLLEEALKQGSQFEINFEGFKNNEKAIDELIFELGVLAKRDGILKEAEKDYILFLAEKMNITDTLVKEIILE